VELFELLMDWLSLIVYETIMECLMYAGLGLLIIDTNSSFYVQRQIITIRGRNGFDWARRIFRARQRAAWLCKNAETI